ncbi:hypothetical protein GNF98_20810 [Clostridium perfringens]
MKKEVNEMGTLSEVEIVEQAMNKTTLYMMSGDKNMIPLKVAIRGFFLF